MRASILPNGESPVSLPPSPTANAGRFAPSPTGILHLGNLRTALLAWAISKNQAADFYLRIEDLDQQRVRPEYIASHLHDLELLGITWDGEVFHQSERISYYQAEFSRLAQTNQLYQCFCSRKEIAQAASAPHGQPGLYPGTCRKLVSDPAALATRWEKWQLVHKNQPHHEPVWRLANSAKSGSSSPFELLSFNDQLYGKQSFPLDDILLTRSDGVFAYNFVSVADDAASGVGLVVRGRDLLETTPRQIFLAQRLGYAIPSYFHVPMLLNEKQIRLAKRDGAITIPALQSLGWEIGDIIELLALTLGLHEVRSATDFRLALADAPLSPKDTCLDISQLSVGPKVLRSYRYIRDNQQITRPLFWKC